ncbi:MAG: tRNA (adenosine(37)-N6)-threonylcarbamoyltransferase complex dimerization subunit type 1 TsaB [Candidatus Lightella neohaematopini]|nr:tRNA (adenosine(37)-N6)-threonylcarbamoyltransferase complex dimerization subunit type 1 TsaB [Candidatus Lightella neohaematopini]MCV2528684.1 tRNA (adenosine(37)-N6)-threonylcarbamoyltransferase complex dimerization subunit type 1 TsaB [Candidatus Lightella neohaematopini]
MNILIINNSTNDYSIALINKYNITLCGIIINNSDYINYLLTIINNVFINSNISLNELHALAFNNGPGSFTKIRIINSIVQGLSFSNNIPLISISNLTVLAEGAWRCTKIKKILVANYAYNNKLYIAKYYKTNNRWYLEDKIILLDIKDILIFCNNLLGNWVLTGDFWFLYPKIKFCVNNKFTILNSSNCNILDMCALVINEFNESKLITPKEIIPIYI